MNSGIYILKWDNCQYYYIGSSVDLIRRKRNHLNRLKNGKHENFILLNIFNKHGLPIFEIMEYCEKEDLNKIEQKYLDKAKGDSNNVNILYSTSGKGKVISEETKEKISKAMIGRKFSESHLENLRKVNRGENNPRYNKPVLSSTRKKLSDTHKGDKNWSAKKVMDITTGKIYGCVKEVIKEFDINYYTLIGKLSGRRKNNTSFRYLHDFASGVGSSDLEINHSPTMNEEINLNLLTN